MYSKRCIQICTPLSILAVVCLGIFAGVLLWYFYFGTQARISQQQTAITKIEGRGGFVFPMLEGDHGPEVQGVFRACTVNFTDSAVSDQDLFLLDNLHSHITLILTRTHITDEGIRILGQLKSSYITRLNIAGTPISDKGLVLLQSLKGLSDLDISDTAITDAGISDCSAIARLSVLRVARTRISDEGIKHIGSVMGPSPPGWAELDLSGTSISNTGLIYLRGLKLEKLDLSGTAITDDGLLHLKEMGGVTRLLLSNTHITDQGLIHLVAVKELDVLILRDTAITDLALKHLQSIPALRALDITGSKVSNAGIESLHRTRPNLHITNGP